MVLDPNEGKLFLEGLRTDNPDLLRRRLRKLGFRFQEGAGGAPDRGKQGEMPEPTPQGALTKGRAVPSATGRQ